eukprot:jgi/Psemu1/55349/gm1.55349_g
MEVTEDWLAEEEEQADRDASFWGRREEGEGVAWVGAGREPDAEERAEEEDREGVDWSLFLGEEAEARPTVDAGEDVGGGMLRFGVGEADEEKRDNSGWDWRVCNSEEKPLTIGESGMGAKRSKENSAAEQEFSVVVRETDGEKCDSAKRHRKEAEWA